MIEGIVLAALILGHAECILSNGGPAGPDDTKQKKDAVPEESIARGFAYGEEGHLGGYSPEGYEHYPGNYEAGKYYGYDEHYKYEHKEHDPAYYKALALKGLLIPLAGVALLGAAAAFVSNPILLQLGVISSTYGRRKRDTRTQLREKYREIQLLEKFMAQASSFPIPGPISAFAIKGALTSGMVPREEIQSHEEKLFAKYLMCSGESACLERLACELHSADGASMPVETDVMAVITSEILSNKFVSDSIKSGIVKAVQRGRTGGGCNVYKCRELANLVEAKQERFVKIKKPLN